MVDTTRLRLVDVGGSGGLEPEWHPYAQQIDAVLFEPNPEAAEDLRRQGYKTVEAALSSVDGTRTLYVTHNPLCISLHRPNPDIVARYDLHEHYQIINEVPIGCRRYDSLFREGAVEIPDVVKVDTQGHEFDVLLGFGGLLSDCLGIVLETHIYPLYHGEKLLGDIVGLLEPFGIVLRRLERTSACDGDFVEANAYFTVSRQRARSLDTARLEKLALLSEIWKLDRYHL